MTDLVRQKLEQFFGKYHLATYPEKHTLIYGDEVPPGVFYLCSGQVRQYDISPKSGDELTFHIYNPGSYFPLIWALGGVPNLHFFQTVTAVEVRLAPQSEVVAFLEQEPEVTLVLAKRLLQGLNGMMTRLQYQVFGNSYAKVTAELLYLARHFGIAEQGGMILSETFTHQTIADFTGMVRETVSIAIGKLMDKGLISYHGRQIAIPSLERLAAELKQSL